MPFGRSRGTLDVDFGTGDIHLHVTRDVGSDLPNGVAFCPGVPAPVGQVGPFRRGETTDDLGCRLHMRFTPESLRAVIGVFHDLLLLMDPAAAPVSQVTVNGRKRATGSRRLTYPEILGFAGLPDDRPYAVVARPPGQEGRPVRPGDVLAVVEGMVLDVAALPHETEPNPPDAGEAAEAPSQR